MEWTVQSTACACSGYSKSKNNNLPIWRAVGGPPASAIKAGRAGVPMMITTLGGPAINFKGSVDAYREAAEQSGFNPASLPVATTSLFYTAKNSQDALSEYYPHINAGMLTLRGGGYPKQQFTNAIDYRDALMVGSPQQIIEKCFTNMNCLGNNVLWQKLILVVYRLIKLRKTSN